MQLDLQGRLIVRCDYRPASVSLLADSPSSCFALTPEDAWRLCSREMPSFFFFFNLWQLLSVEVPLTYPQIAYLLF